MFQYKLMLINIIVYNNIYRILDVRNCMSKYYTLNAN